MGVPSEGAGPSRMTRLLFARPLVSRLPVTATRVGEPRFSRRLHRVLHWKLHDAHYVGDWLESGPRLRLGLDLPERAEGSPVRCLTWAAESLFAGNLSRRGTPPSRRSSGSQARTSARNPDPSRGSGSASIPETTRLMRTQKALRGAFWRFWTVKIQDTNNSHREASPCPSSSLWSRSIVESSTL